MTDARSRLVANLQKASRGIGTVEPSQGEVSFQLMRRSRRPNEEQRLRMQLVEVDGVLEWEEVTGRVAQPRRFRGAGVPSAGGDAIADFEFERLPPSQITSFLAGQDRKLTPKRHLRRWDAAAAKLKPAKAPADGEALVLVHGTFSNGDNFIKALRRTPEGSQFLADANTRYKGQVYVFDHPTLSVGPILNAIDLHSHFETANSKATVDVVSHSRGGLVTRWWFDHFDPNARRCRKAILVGSPLAGTRLASPYNIRKTIKLLTNVGNAVGAVAGWAKVAVPVLVVVETLLTVVTSVGRLASKTPLVDGLIAMVPGIFAQSAVGNNPELERLLESRTSLDRYCAIAANYEPVDPGWAFWKRFRKDYLLDAGVDAIFTGKNDLVVDTLSMQMFGNQQNLPVDQVYDFGDTPTVHHLNYFQQPETIAFLRAHLL